MGNGAHKTATQEKIASVKKNIAAAMAAGLTGAVLDGERLLWLLESGSVK